MIPETSDFLSRDFIIKNQPTRTYKLYIDEKAIRGFTDGQDAMRQLIYKILNTERYKYVIYTWNFGVELQSLYGMPMSFVLPEIKRRVTEALTQDVRIQSVDAFDFEIKRNAVSATFVAHTIFGDIPEGVTVNV